MTRLFVRRDWLRVAFGSGLALLLPAARACEFYATTLRVTHPWTRETAEGETSAIVCMDFDEVLHDDRLIGAESPLAEGAEMAGLGASSVVDFTILKGSAIKLCETGTTLRLLGLKEPLEVGRVYPLRLIFERGGSVMTDLSVDYARAT